MKRLLQYISAFMLCGAMLFPLTADAQGRHNGNTNGGRVERGHSSHGNTPSRGGNSGANRPSPSHNTSASRPSGSHGNNTRPSISNSNKNHGNRPDHGNGPNNALKPGNNTRPSVGNGNNNNRPSVGNGNHNNNRPSVGNGNHNNNNRPSVGNGNRPGNLPNNNVRPGNDHGTRPSIGTAKPNHTPTVHPGNLRPGHNNHPGGSHGFGPGHNPAPRPPMVTPPHRPYRPVIARPHYRPMPPRGWRPAGRVPLIRGILGLTFGTAINLSLDYLFNAGYNVDGYTNDIVYLRNVSAMNYVWTDAALYYGNAGLDASSFYYSTPTYNLSRYNNVYNSLVATYGAPVSVNNTVNSMTATWFGGNNGYVTLSFGANNIGSNLRYLTTLTFGL